MAINEMIPLAGQGVEFGRSALSGAVAGNQLVRAMEERRNAPMLREAAQMELESGKIKLTEQKALEQLRSAAIDGSYIRQDLASGDMKTAISRLEQRNQRLLAEGRDNTHTQRAMAALQSGDPAQIQAFGQELAEIDRAYQQYGGGGLGGESAAEREFQAMTAGMSPQDIERARRIAMGLDPRAMGSSAITIAQQGYTDPVAASQGVIAGSVAANQQAQKAAYAGDIAAKAEIGRNTAAMGGQGIPSAADVAAEKTAAQENAKNTAEKLAAAPTAIIRGERLVNLLNKGLSHPGREAATGGSSVFNDLALPGSDRKDYLVLARQFKGSGFLEAYQLLKGGGAITNIEGEKAEQAQNRLNEAQSEDEYTIALQEMRDLAQDGVTRTKILLETNGQAPQTPPQSAPQSPRFLGFE